MKIFKQVVPYLLAVLCLVVSGAHVLDGLGSMSPSKDMVSGWEERMKLIRRVLPADVFEAGYLDQADIPNASAWSDPAEFFLAQYGIAPIVLLRGFESDWIIGNFGGSVSLESIQPWLDQRLGNYTIQDLGFGIYLIHDIED